MIGSGVDSIGSDGVGTELLEKGHVSDAEFLVGKRINILGGLFVGGTRGGGILLVGDTFHKELSSILIELGALDLYWLEIGYNHPCQGRDSKSPDNPMLSDELDIAEGDDDRKAKSLLAGERRICEKMLSPSSG